MRPAVNATAIRPRQLHATDTEEINFRAQVGTPRKNLNANGTLFSGSLVRWIDEEATIYASLRLGNGSVVTKFISEINFVSSAQQGDLIERCLRAIASGKTSLTMRAEVRNMITRKSILTIIQIVFVKRDERGVPAAHGYTDITFLRGRVPARHLVPVAPEGDLISYGPEPWRAECQPADRARRVRKLTLI